MQKSRSYFWDNFKGILIFLVVLGHYLYGYAVHMDGRLVDDVFTFIYIFHMPAFVFCSGYLSKSEKSRSAKGIMQLLLYYLVFNTAMMCFAHFYLGSKIKLLTPYYSYWYLLSLIAWRLVIGGFAKFKVIVPVTFAVTLLMGYSNEFTNLLSIRRTVGFFIFFLVGYLFKKDTFETFINKRNKKLIIAGILLGLVVSAAAFWVVRTDAITLNMCLWASYKKPEDILIRGFLLAVSFAMIAVLMLIIPKNKVPFLTQIGKNSLLIYLVHRFVTLVYAKEFHYSEYTRMHWLYMIIATVLTCAVLGLDKLNCAVSKKFADAAEKLE